MTIVNNDIDPGMMLEKFPHWLSDPLAPKRIRYWRGFLCDDRIRSVSHYDEETQAWGRDRDEVVPAIDALAKMVWRCYKRGQVHLVQDKIGDDVYDYYAVKSTATWV
jgi:hypothetical protein